MMPAGLYGLHVVLGQFNAKRGVWLEHPSADFTCVCGYTSAAHGAGPVALFCAEEPARHRKECPGVRVMVLRGRRVRDVPVGDVL